MPHPNCSSEVQYNINQIKTSVGERMVVDDVFSLPGSRILSTYMNERARENGPESKKVREQEHVLTLHSYSLVTLKVKERQNLVAPKEHHPTRC